MSRNKLPVGTWGSITITPAGGKYRARCRFRDFTGRTVQVEAWGPSKTAADRALKASLNDRVAATGYEIRPDMTLAALATLWLEECEVSELLPQSVDRYRDTVERIVVPGLGGRRIQETTTSVLDRFLKVLAKDRPGQAKQAKVVLSGMLGLAARHDAVRTNPIRDVAMPRNKRKPVRALTLDDIEVLRRGVALWQADPHQRGPKRAPDLLDVVDFMLATGARIGELCAIRWSDVDLSAVRPTVTISGTVVRVSGQGLFRQPHPKSAAGFRTVTLPRFAVETLLRRQVMGYPNPHDVVFPSSTGTLRDPQWRDARAAAGFEWVVPHSFRKTVATLIDRETGTRDAASQLGHSGTAVTAAHYVQRATIAPDMSEVLERLSGRGDSVGTQSN